MVSFLYEYAAMRIFVIFSPNSKNISRVKDFYKRKRDTKWGTHFSRKTFHISPGLDVEVIHKTVESSSGKSRRCIDEDKNHCCKQGEMNHSC